MSSKGKRDRIENDFYETPPWVVGRAMTLATRLWKDSLKHLHEPFAGRGAFIGPIAHARPDITFSMTEIDEARAEIALQQANGRGKLVGADAFTTKVELPPGSVVMTNTPFFDPLAALDLVLFDDIISRENFLGAVVYGPAAWLNSEDRREWWIDRGAKNLRFYAPLPHRVCCAWPCTGKIEVEGKLEKCRKMYPPGSMFDCPYCGGKPKPAVDSVDSALYVWDKSWEGRPEMFFLKTVPLASRKMLWFAPVTECPEHMMPAKEEVQEPTQMDINDLLESQEASSSPEEPEPVKEPEPEPVKEPEPEPVKEPEPEVVEPVEEPEPEPEAPAKALPRAKKAPKEEGLDVDSERRKAHLQKLIFEMLLDGKVTEEELLEEIERVQSHLKPSARLSVEEVKELIPKPADFDTSGIKPLLLSGLNPRQKILQASVFTGLARLRVKGSTPTAAEGKINAFQARQGSDAIPASVVGKVADYIFDLSTAEIADFCQRTKSEPGGPFCEECGFPQYATPGGPTCILGHGGALSIDITGQPHDAS